MYLCIYIALLAFSSYSVQRVYCNVFIIYMHYLHIHIYMHYTYTWIIVTHDSMLSCTYTHNIYNTYSTWTYTHFGSCTLHWKFVYFVASLLCGTFHSRLLCTLMSRVMVNTYFILGRRVDARRHLY
jgi:hypothetical protein